jgi:hypothetical protein
MERTGKTILIIFATVLFLILLSLFVRSLIAVNIKNKHKIISINGIDEKLNLPIKGINQYLYIRGQDTEKTLSFYFYMAVLEIQ